MSEVSFSSTLFVLRGKDRGRRFELNSRSTTIGRHGTNDVQLLDNKASRRHAELIFEGSRYKLVDLESSNGTLINDQRVEVTYLTSGDKISIGNSVLLFTEGMSLSSDGTGSSINLADLQEETAEQSRVIRSIHADSIPEFTELISTDTSLGIEKAHERLRILYGAALSNSTSTDIDEILERMLEIIFQLVDARYGCIMLMDEEQDFDVKVQVRKVSDPSIDKDQYEVPRVILERALEQDQGILASRQVKVNDVAEQRQVICTPMYGRYGRVGLIYIESLLKIEEDSSNVSPSDSELGLSRGFTEEHLKLIITIGHQAGIAIEDKIFSNALIHSERMSAIGEIVAMLAHQVKNIMQGIGGGGYMIKRGLSENDPSVIEQGWKIVEKNQGRISDLILDMLSFSKDRQPQLKPVRLSETILDALELVESYAEQYDVTIINSVPDNVTLMVDAEMIQRTVHNLLLNGIDACSENQGTVHIRFKKTAEHYIIEFEDDGVGIKKQNLKRIFSPFQSTKGGRGTGLGLTIARKSCREHGGELKVTSEFGKGTVFRMTLPIVQHDPADVHSDPEVTGQNEQTITKVMHFKGANRDTKT